MKTFSHFLGTLLYQGMFQCTGLVTFHEKKNWGNSVALMANCVELFGRRGLLSGKLHDFSLILFSLVTHNYMKFYTVY